MSEKIHTYCRVCEAACGMIAEVEDGKILTLGPDKDHPVSKGYFCHKGTRYLDIHQDPDRLTYPLKRGNPRSEDKGDFARVSWDQAVAEIGEKLKDIARRYGDGAIASYVGHPQFSNTSFFPVAGSLMTGFGGPHFGAFTIDCANKFAGSEGIYGFWGLQTIPDLLHTDYFLAVGSNPAVSHMTIMNLLDPMAKLRDIKRRGGKSVFVNPRHIESATPETGEVVLIRPDTDFYFLAALLHEIIFQIGYDRQYAESRSKNLDGLIEFVKDWPVERAAAVTDIPADTIRQIAREFCAARSASLLMSTGVNMGRHGLLAYWMVQMISFLTGNLGRRGGNIHPRPIIGSKAPPIRKEVQDNPFFETEFGKLRNTNGQLPATVMADVLHSKRNPIKALIVSCGNPLISIPGEERMRAALRDLELIVAVDIYPSATAELADYILPAKDFLEREDVKILAGMIQLEPHAQYTPAVVPAAGERRDDWWIIARLLQAMGKPSPLDAPHPNPFGGGVEAMLQYRNLSIEKLKQAPGYTVVFPQNADLEDSFRFSIQNEGDLIDCCPNVFKQAYASAEEHWQKLVAEPEGQLKLITRRTGMGINTGWSNVSAHKKGVHMTNPLWMNPQDAEERGLFPGSEVNVRSDHGQLQASLVLDETLKQGVVAMSHGWGQNKAYGLSNARRFPGANVNRLMPVGRGSFDPVSMQAQLTGINVTVTAILGNDVVATA